MEAKEKFEFFKNVFGESYISPNTIIYISSIRGVCDVENNYKSKAPYRFTIKTTEVEMGEKLSPRYDHNQLPLHQSMVNTGYQGKTYKSNGYHTMEEAKDDIIKLLKLKSKESC